MSKSRHFDWLKIRRPRQAVVAVIVSLATLGGCAVSRTEGETLTLSNPLYLTVLCTALGVAIAVVGALLIAGRIRVKRKRFALGGFLLVVGTVLAAGVVTTTPYERLVVSPAEVRSYRGSFGARQQLVALEKIERLVIYKGRFPRDSPKHSRGPLTYVEFVDTEGPSIHIKMREPKCTPAIRHLLKLASQLGIEVNDQRDEYSRYRLGRD